MRSQRHTSTEGEEHGLDLAPMLDFERNLLLVFNITTTFVKEPRAVNNWSEFRREFVGEGGKSNDLSHAVFGFFQEGGSRCFVVNIGDARTLGAGLATLESLDEVAIVAAPGYCDAMAYADVLTHCEKMADRVGILDPPEVVDKIEDLIEQAVAVKEGAKPSSAKGPPIEAQTTMEVRPASCRKHMPSPRAMVAAPRRAASWRTRSSSGVGSCTGTQSTSTGTPASSAVPVAIAPRPRTRSACSSPSNGSRGSWGTNR